MATKKRRPAGTGRVRQLSSGRWQARYIDSLGRLVAAPLTFDAKIYAEGWLADQAEGIPPTEPKIDPRLSEFAERWLADRDLKPRTRADYQLLLDKRILPTLGHLRLSRITVRRVHDWYHDLSPKTPTLRARTYGLLRTIMITAWQQDYVEANPCRVRGGGSAKRKHQTKIASVPELEAIAAAMPERYRAMILLAGWCALRYGEVTELRRSDVDLATGVLHIRRGVVRVGSDVIVGTPKSSAGIREVAIPPHLIPALREHLANHVCREPGALLFPASGNPMEHLAPSTLYAVYHPARAKAGRPDLRFHDLRHTGLTLAAATGATTADLMARAGHSTAAAAMIYQHSVADRDQAIAEALSGFAASKVIPLKARRTKARI
jgi:integrase